MYHTNNTFISRLILLSGNIQFNPGPVSRVGLYSFNTWTLNIRSFNNPFHYTAILITLMSLLLLKLGFLLTLPLLNNLVLCLMVSLSLIGYTLSGSCFMHFNSVNLANFSPHLLSLSNPWNCPQSRSDFLTLIWLYIISIVLINLLQNLGLCVFFSVSKTFGLL